MSVNYNTLKSMKGMAIGTIIPWSGPISGDFGIPKGWLACTANRVLEASDYPELFEIIGNRYGGFPSQGTFALPSLPGRNLVDYHPSHAAELGYTGNFASLIGANNDVANQNTTTQSSNIDLRVNLDPIVGNIRATMTGMNINVSNYTTTYGYVPRRLGDGHMGTHGHAAPGEDGYDSVRVTNSRIEACQDDGFFGLFNCIFVGGGCNDNCGDADLYKSGNDPNATDDFCLPKYDGGEHLGRGQVPYGTNRGRMARTNTPRNYINRNDDCLLYNEVSSDPGVGEGNDGAWEGIYGTTLMTDVVNFTNSQLVGHEHTSQTLTVSSGNVASKETVRINTISTGTITPVNVDNQEVLTITANVNTPSIQMVYIIKAY